MEKGVDSSGGAGCEVDLIWVGWVSIASCDMSDSCLYEGERR